MSAANARLIARARAEDRADHPTIAEAITQVCATGRPVIAYGSGDRPWIRVAPLAVVHGKTITTTTRHATRQAAEKENRA